MIAQLTDNTIGIVVPKDAWNFDLYGDLGTVSLGYFHSFNEGKVKQSFIYVPKGDWEQIGKADQLSEEQWKGVVEKWDSGMFTDYERHLARVPTATESGHSLLRKHNLEKETTVILKRKNK